MENSLPLGFDPGFWRVMPCNVGVTRDVANGDSITVSSDLQGWCYTRVISNGMVIRGDSHETSKKAAAFANTYAESHGGWA